MNKEYALEILNEVQGTSPAYIREYGASLVKEAKNYLDRLNRSRRTPDAQIAYLLDNVTDKLMRL
jgi:hypothetical protein